MCGKWFDLIFTMIIFVGLIGIIIYILKEYFKNGY
jgi:hypothetical protein